MRQAPCSSRTWIHFLYGVIAILLFAVVLLSRSQFGALCRDPLLRPVGCGAAEDTLRSLVVLPGRKQVVEKETAAEETVQSGTLSRNEITSQDGWDVDMQKEGKSRPKVLGFVGIQTGFTSAERRKALRETWFPSTPEGITRYGR